MKGKLFFYPESVEMMLKGLNVNLEENYLTEPPPPL
jgi:hypothetical protein